MKKLQAVILLFFLGSLGMQAQQTPQLDAKVRAEEEAVPHIFSFAPNYQQSREKERVELEQKIARIDSLDISETRKYRLIRDLYRNKESKRLHKAMLTETDFDEHDTEEENID